MTSFILSTLVFFVVGYLVRKYLDDHGLEGRLLRSMLIFLVALLASLGAAAAIDWIDAQYGASVESKAAFGEMPFGRVAHHASPMPPFAAP